MSKVKFDLRFVEIFYELGALERYLDSLENQLPTIARQEEEKAYARLRNEKLKSDLAERDAILQELYNLTEEVLPRFFRGAILVTLWAIFESAVIVIANEIRDQQKLTLTINDLRGDFLERAKKYFDLVLKFRLTSNNRNWDRIRMLKVLRNALAHANGRMDHIRSEIDVRNIKKWETNDIGLSIENGNLLFSEQFVRQILSVVYETLDDLTRRIFGEYPEPINW